MSKSRPQDRVEWVDAAKGIAILLVVLHHSVLLLGQLNLLVGPWVQINNAFQIFRMPLFFAASGLFAASVLSRPWGQLWSKRLSLYLWVFILWSLIRFAYFAAFPIAARPDENDPIRLLLAPLLPSTGLWFLHALFFFFIAAKLLHGRVDFRVQLAVSAVASIGFLSFIGGNISWTGMGKYFFFFLAGCYMREAIVRLVSSRRWFYLPASGLLFGVSVILIGAFDLQSVGPVAFLVRIVAVLFGFLLAASLMVGHLGKLLQHLGRSTLEIYVAHIIFIAAIGTLVAHMGGVGGAGGFALPLITTVASAAGSLMLHLGLTRVPGGNVAYRAPVWLSGRHSSIQPVA